MKPHKLAPTHLMIDGYIGESAVASHENVERYFEQLSWHLDMTRIVDPTVVWDKGNTIAMQIIAESHISLHIDGTTGWFYGDVFSCKEFDVLSAIKYIKDYWRLAPMRYQLHHRTVPA